ncbi:timeless-domain-containing protein [Rhizoclosmatium globosum]|uniref:Timeless-domain-containing protein n=1 Tax=Rhizoclosmatium globosum TaxID=329046 RepID=A0A1Y2CL20_9FUNG|nr:timeless-domain-containing protein [Rhizoclosmatium globosum]|eukprot:ORY47718.1 timeless-domain-containing protein [Rhizoclosmatium globosum]
MDPTLAYHTQLEETRLARQDDDRNRVLNICSALGGFEDCLETGGKVYVPGDEASDCLRDLKKILRADNETPERDVYGVLGEWNVLGRDLLPLLLATDVEKDYKRAMLIVELVVPLTWATSLEYKHSPNQMEVLLKYKEAFLNTAVLEKIMQVLLKSLAIPHRDRREKDNAKIRLILTLFRNLLAIKDPQVSAKSSSEFNYRAALQERLIKEFSEYNMLILEIWYLVFRERTCASILEDTDVIQNDNLLKLAKQELTSKAARPMKSRHSRFGGTLSLNLGNGQQVNFFSTSTALKSVENAMDIGKTKGRAVRKGQAETITKTVIRDEQAKQVLRETADSFLENSFNSLIASVKDDIDKERQHVVDGDFVRFLVLVRFFLEYQVELLKKVVDPVEKEKFDFDTVTDFINSRSMLFVTKRMQIYLDEKKWPELQSALECLKQMLVTLNAMAASGNEEYQDASNNIQNNLYYEAFIIESIAHLCKTFKDQSFSYLKNLVETVHIFLKMLEKFSKSKAFMVVRRKKRAKAKAIAKSIGNTLTPEETSIALDPVDPEEEPPMDEATVKRKCVEHEFQFEKIEMDFAYENVRYREVEPRYLHYATTMMHRVFVKAKMEPLLFKLSTFDLFNRIVQDERLMSLKEFIRYVIKRFTAKAKEDPILLWRSDCRRIMHGADEDMNVSARKKIFDDVDGDEFGRGGDGKKNDAMQVSDGELEVQRDLTWSQKVGVVDKLALLEWVETTLTSVAPKRMFDEEQPDVEIGNFDLTEAAASNQNVSISLKRDKKLFLLLELMKVTKFIEGDADIRWLVESTRSADDIISDEPLDSNGKPLRKMIRKKPKKRAPKKKEVGDEDEEDVPKEKKKVEKEPQTFLSKQFIEDSDDDDDAAFFEAERQRRLKAAELAGVSKVTESKVKPALPSIKSNSSDSGVGASSDPDDNEENGSSPKKQLGYLNTKKRIISLTISQSEITAPKAQKKGVVGKMKAKKQIVSLSESESEEESEVQSDSESDVDGPLELKNKKDLGLKRKNIATEMEIERIWT